MTSAEKKKSLLGYKWINPDALSWYDGKFGPWKPNARLSVDGATAG